MGSPIRIGTPRLSFASKYLGGSDSLGSLPSIASDAAITIVNRCCWRSTAGARSGRAARSSSHRLVEISCSSLELGRGAMTRGICLRQSRLAHNRLAGIMRGIPEGELRIMINVSETAASKISELLVEENKAGSGLRVFVQGGGCSGFQYGLMIEENGQGAGDQVFESHGVKLFVDPISIRYLKGAEVDFVDTVTGGGFTIKNPNATSTCGCGSSFSTE